MSLPLQPVSLGILQDGPTQFDEPVYTMAAATPDIRLTVYYHGATARQRIRDPEIGRTVGWGGAGRHSYTAVYRDRESAWLFLKRLLRAGHDLVIVSGYNKPIPVLAALLGRLYRVPLGLRSDNVLPEVGGSGRYWTLKQILYPLWFRLYATGHPASVGATRYLVRFGFSEGMLFRFPYCMDRATFSPAAESARRERMAIRQRWNLPPEAMVVCGVLKFAPREDPITLVRAVREARRRRGDLVLLLVGDGPLRSAVEREAGPDIGRYVVMPGYLPHADLPEVYAASDLFVHPAQGAWEVSVAEALACGIPVVAADTVGSVEELIRPTGLGRIFPRGNVPALAAAILDVAGDRAMRERCRTEGPLAVESIRPERALAEWRRAVDRVRTFRSGTDETA